MEQKGEHMSAQNNRSTNSSISTGSNNVLKNGWGPRTTPAPTPKPPKAK